MESCSVGLPAYHWSYPETSAQCSSLATKTELWMRREAAKRLFSTDPQPGALLSLSCRVISAYFLMNLTAAVEACGRLKEALLFRLFSSSFTQTDTQEADGSLHTAPYFLNSSVTVGLSGTAKRAQITSDTFAVPSQSYSHTIDIRQQICSAWTLNTECW